MKNLTEQATLSDVIIAAAYAGVKISNQTDAEVEMATALRALKLKEILTNERSLANKLMGAVVIKCEIVDVQFDDNCQRYQITFIADNSKEREQETIRTDRMDNKNAAMDAEYIEALKGHKAVIYKINEDSDKLKGSGYRIAPYIKVID